MNTPANDRDDLNDDLTGKNESKTNDLAAWVQDALSNADTHFPLSGGETEEDFAPDNEDEETEEKEPKSFFDHLDTNFPLSGGADDHTPEI